ncbi:Solute carrier family 25 member 38-like protein [Hirsutella minnesotensis 3608]|uniref:Mitochondrial glycine transporter n=1 Tax=Hirsutella minnesotensis 3608 TaxID=1043627 RepID=A0A0F7ZXR7_9HYPO|nr:Solute carrier family 25 member 38-like protein [Hirsutella minnesotensis 3608]
MTETHSPKHAKPALHFVSGLGSGLASAVILQPLDLLKTRVQQSNRPSLASCLRDAQQSPHIVRALWRGTVPSALRTGFGSALYLTSLNAIRQRFNSLSPIEQRAKHQRSSSSLPTLTKAGNLVSGAAARTFAGWVLMPLTVIKTRFESSLYSYPSMFAAAGDIARKNGVRGFFAGFGATAMRDAPYAGMYVVFYELLKTQASLWASTHYLEVDRATMQTPLAGLINFSSATVAGAACSAISNPFDAVKTRIQLQPRLYRNVWQAAYLMATQDGLRSFWDGLALRMSRKALSSALAWTLYEEFIRASGAKM